MSLAGVRSNRGDTYQTLIAIDWAITMLYEPSIAWLEVDSTSIDALQRPLVVDDVVIKYLDGHHVYCQCKKNQTDFKAWSLSELDEELAKAGSQLAGDSSGIVNFYSRSDFGDIAKLREHLATQPDGKAYIQSLTPALQATHGHLVKVWATSLQSCSGDVFNFLHRMRFETTQDFERITIRQIGLLRLHVTNVKQVYEALYSRLDNIASRIAPHGQQSSALLSSCLTRDDLLLLIAGAGSEISAPREQADLEKEFFAISAIGRSWRREIGQKRLVRTAYRELLAGIEKKPRTILVTDGPGSGKTCLLLDVVDELEKSGTSAVLYVQAREFSDCLTDSERTARGLPAKPLADVARMAEYKHTVVVIDSLDVLSLARDNAVLAYFLSLVDRLEKLQNVTVVAACRNFDLKYDKRLSNRSWTETIKLGLLDWDSEVIPLLSEWGVLPGQVNSALKQLLVTPRLLALFEEIFRRGQLSNANTAQELTQHYLDTVILKNPSLGSPAMEQVERLSKQMLDQRRLDMPRLRANIPDTIATALRSEGVICETTNGGIAFSHQTLLDVLAVSSAERAGQSLYSFIRNQPATPFVRPSIRTFFFHLRAVDITGFYGQVRATIDAADVSFHIKRLICESLAEVIPIADDWRLVSHIFNAHPALFSTLYARAKSENWISFFDRYWVPEVIREKQSAWLEQHIEYVATAKHSKPAYAIRFWINALDLGWVNQTRAVTSIALHLHDFKAWDAPNIRELLERLVSAERPDRDFLGDSVRQWVDATGTGDELLWRYITSEITPDVVANYRMDRKLHCGPSEFRDPGFLKRRMSVSDSLLDFALAAIEQWSKLKAQAYSTKRDWHDNFLPFTSYRHEHTRHEHDYIEAEHVLLDAIEQTCLKHAEINSTWWQTNAERLRASHEAALRYITLQAYAKCPHANLQGIAATLTDQTMLESKFSYEVGNVLNSAFIYMEGEVQDQILESILSLYDDPNCTNNSQDTWVMRVRRDYLAAIPGFLRSHRAQEYLDAARAQSLDEVRQPQIHSSGGMVVAPFSYEHILRLSDQQLVSVLKHYQNSHRDDWGHHEYVGGTSEVGSQVRQAASRDPIRFLNILNQHWSSIADVFCEEILAGAAAHTRYRFGNLTDSSWSATHLPGSDLLVTRLLEELEGHPAFWRGRREAAEAVLVCSHIASEEVDTARLVFQLVGFLDMNDPSLGEPVGDRLDSIAINSVRGRAAEAVVILANRLAESGKPLPELLQPLLHRFACDQHPAVRAILIRHLPVLQYHLPVLGWSVFDTSMRDAGADLWLYAEQCLYYDYHRQYDRVRPYLDQLEVVDSEKTAATWGRISTLSTLQGHLTIKELLDTLSRRNNPGAWDGAAAVFCSNASVHEYRDICFTGLKECLTRMSEPWVIASKLTKLFDCKPHAIEIPAVLLTRTFELLADTRSGHQNMPHEFYDWAAARANSYPDSTLDTFESALHIIPDEKLEKWHNEPIVQLLTTLFREAEDREESDGGALLERVIKLQDILLRKGFYLIDEWLRDAERP